MKILIVDNYDSFTWNLVHYTEQFAHQVDVIRNNEIDLNQIEQYDGIIISPGPGLPKDAGYSPKIINDFAGKIPLLGVCLGHQAITECFGGKLLNLPRVLHGIAIETLINITDEALFRDIPASIKTGRYHSWVSDPETFPDELEVTATDVYGHIMALRHRQLNIRGIQFHPESIMTEFGLKMIENWCKHCVQPQ